ncbi:MAG: cupredoxin domain-containing protein, partial [Patescibacteria group bacterium]
SQGEFQEVRMELNYGQYIPSVLEVKVGIPVRWIIDVKHSTGCTNIIQIPKHRIRQRLKEGINTIEFTPQEKGRLDFSCGMQMVWGRFIVK